VTSENPLLEAKLSHLVPHSHTLVGVADVHGFVKAGEVYGEYFSFM